MDDLIHRIYDAALRPESWPDVLTRLADIASAEGAILFAAGGGDVNWIASPRMQDHAAAYFQSDMPDYDDRTARLAKLASPGFVTDYDVFTPAEFEQDPIIRDFFRPRGLGWGVATMFSVPTGHSFILHCERRFETGPVNQTTVDVLDRYRPHLARAALLSAQFELMRAAATADTLQSIGLAAAVIGHGGRFLAINNIMSELVPSVMNDARGRVQLVNLPANQLFQQALAAISRSGHAAVQSIPMAASDGQPAMVAHLLPIPARSAGRDVFAGSVAIVVITKARDLGLLPSLVLETLFDLTPAEARIARSIASGIQIQDAARQSGVAVETVRNQLKSVFAKLGVQRQAELVALIGQLSL